MSCYARLLCLLTGVFLLRPVSAQSPTPLETLDDHFLGRWSGPHHDFTKDPTVEDVVNINITLDKKRERILLTYSYGAKGSEYDYFTRWIQFEPETDTLQMKREDGKFRYKVTGLRDLVRIGYGDFTLTRNYWQNGRRAVYKADYHLTPQSFSYEVYVEADGKPLAKTGDWMLTRTQAVP